MEFRVGRGVFSNLEQRLEDIFNVSLGLTSNAELTPDNIFEIVHQSTAFEDLVYPRHLEEPSDIVRHQFMVDDPFSQFVPFTEIPVCQL